MTNSNRHTIFKSNNIFLELENTPEIGWTLHCQIQEWSKSIYKEYLEVWVDIIEMLREKGITELYIYAHDDMPYKFANIFGFEPTGLQGIGANNTTRDLWRYTLDG